MKVVALLVLNVLKSKAMNRAIQDAVKFLERERAEIDKALATLTGKSVNSKGKKWSAARRRKFQATMAAKKKKP